MFSGENKDYAAPDDITDRMMMRFVNEAVACLREGIVDSADLLDGGVIFGTGFAPFRGGPMHYIEKSGKEKLHHTLDKLELQHGPRFRADTGWKSAD